MLELNPGTYGAYLVGATTTKASTGTPQIVLEFKVSFRAENGQWKALPEQKERRVYLSLSSAAWSYSQEKLNALGFNGDFNAPKFSATKSQLVCTHETYNNKLHERWDLPGGGGRQLEKAPDDMIRDLNARWQSMSAPPIGQPEYAPPAAQTERPPVDESDGLPAPEVVPF